MATITTTVQVIRGAVATAGAPSLDIAALVPLADPVGDGAALIARYSSTLNIIQKQTIAEQFLQLRAAGVLAKLDMLCVRGLNAADSLMNWVNPARPAINNGAAFTAKSGFATDGVASWINLNFASGGHFALSSACAGAYVPGTPTFANNAPLIAHGPSGSAQMRIYPQTSTLGQALARVNSSTSSVAQRVRADCGGFWHAERVAGNQTLYQDTTKLIDAAVAAALITPGLSIGQVGGVFGVIPAVSAWWWGEPLTDAQRAALKGAVETLNLVM